MIYAICAGALVSMLSFCFALYGIYRGHMYGPFNTNLGYYVFGMLAEKCFPVALMITVSLICVIFEVPWIYIAGMAVLACITGIVLMRMGITCIVQRAKKKHEERTAASIREAAEHKKSEAAGKTLEHAPDGTPWIRAKVFYPDAPEDGSQ